MCTVTFIPYNNSVFITSNRDEKQRRLSAIPPQEYDFPSGKQYYPKDADAGGTWFAQHENGNAVVLLNGGFIYHESKPPYRKSRGLIVIELLEHDSPFDLFRSISLDDIEPFTLVIWEDNNLFECRWDGERRHAKMLDKTLPYIWSSATLYDEAAAAKREQWFEEWLDRQVSFTQNEILNFHRFAGDGDGLNDLTMNRDGKVFTVSITGVEITGTKAQITYLDLLDDKTYLQDVEINKALADR
ncbi:MAG: NRDE family protein [Chitinophagaceae bacterium]|nr:NRDE family protein [Chitinophagaceae bacterium]